MVKIESTNPQGLPPTSHRDLRAIIKRIQVKRGIISDACELGDTNLPAEQPANDRVGNTKSNTPSRAEMVEAIRGDMLREPDADPKPELQPDPAPQVDSGFAPMVPHKVFVSRDINWTCKGLYGWMLWYAHGRELCHASQDLIAEQLGVSLDTVQRAIQKLRKAKFIEVLPDVRMNANSYRLLVRHHPKQGRKDAAKSPSP